MITRIVKMSFDPEKTNNFLEIFNSSKDKIRAFPGCLYLSLHQNHHFPNIFYTLSKWESQDHLDFYRQSELFTTTWNATKVLFIDKPEAHSLVNLMELK